MIYKRIPNPMGTTYIISDKEIKRLVAKFNASHLTSNEKLSLTGNTSKFGFEVVFMTLYSLILIFINADLSFDIYIFCIKRSYQEM